MRTLALSTVQSVVGLRINNSFCYRVQLFTFNPKECEKKHAL